MSAEVPRLWPGSTVVCVASGPSLTQTDVDFVRGKARVIVINTSYLRCPWADVLYAADGDKWWKWYGERVKRGEWPVFEGLKYSLHRDAAKHGAVVLLSGKGPGLDPRPTHLVAGMNSGYQAIGLAVLLGASRIVLLGYDAQRGPRGEEHWHGDHPNGVKTPHDAHRSYYAHLVAPLKAAGVEIVNCTRRTAITCFPRMELRRALADTAVAA